ncbi:MAG: VanW family protein [Caldilineaceae bacterium]
MVEVPPAVDMNRVAEMEIRELVASGTSYFRGSGRILAVEVAAEKFDGLVIPPNELFSFNEGVEDVTSANGFEDSLVILGDTTAVGVGGGVCQVSTTVFRAAYSGGFPIVERWNHGYVVSWYGEPGLDATIYTPTVDFRFRNDTGAYLLVEPVVDGVAGVITFNLYGTKPDRVVTIGVPNRSDVIEPEPPTYRVNEALATGERKQVEWEREMTVTVERTIVENGTAPGYDHERLFTLASSLRSGTRYEYPGHMLTGPIRRGAGREHCDYADAQFTGHGAIAQTAVPKRNR